jgi:guanylate kinase
MEYPFYVLAGGSAVGKTALAEHVATEYGKELQNLFGLELRRIVTSTTREPRTEPKKEFNAVDYFFVGLQSFQQAITAGVLVEYKEVFKDKFYGLHINQLRQLEQFGAMGYMPLDVDGGHKMQMLRHERDKGNNLILLAEENDLGYLNIPLQFMPITIGIHAEFDICLQRLEKDVDAGIRDPKESQKRIDRLPYELERTLKFQNIVRNNGTLEQSGKMVMAILREEAKLYHQRLKAIA